MLLHTASLLHRNHWPMLAQRIKILAGMDIVDTKAIQDGRFAMQVEGRAIDFRASVLPTQFGENIVIRVLDQSRALLPLETLGFTAGQQQLLKRLCLRPEGMMVITGPTGSGKTTTLYALLQNLNNDSVNIMTLEDPIEYQLQGIRQTQVREQYGLGFADGVRAILRQDPNVVLIGDGRDIRTSLFHIAALYQVESRQAVDALLKNSSMGITLTVGLLLAAMVVGVIYPLYAGLNAMVSH